jgi:hypothetical protein
MLRRTMVSLIAYSVFAGCSEGKGPTDPAAGVSGSWRLQTVNGVSLPFTMSGNGAVKTELTGEVITLIAPSGVNCVTTFRVTDGAKISTESVPDAGSYTIDGSTVRIKWTSDGSVTTVTVAGDTMTDADSEDGLTFVYRRE